MITKNYRKMCAKAGEIQKLWKHEERNMFAYRKDKEKGIIIWLEEVKHLRGKGYVWLPTLEQLMNMVYEIIGLGETHLYGVIETILEFMGQEYKDNYIPDEYFTTAKEKLLAFVYKMKHNKIWTGKKWVKANE